MHNLHLAVIKADSPEKACISVETQIADWGTENNWRSITGWVSDTNESAVVEADGHYTVDEDTNTIEKLNALVKSWINPCNHDNKKINKLMSKVIKGGKLEKHDWYTIETYAKFMKESRNTIDFNILKHEYCSWNFDENGVTNFLGEGKQKYVVFIDMHS